MNPVLAMGLAYSVLVVLAILLAGVIDGWTGRRAFVSDSLAWAAVALSPLAMAAVAIGLILEVTQ